MSNTVQLPIPGSQGPARSKDRHDWIDMAIRLATSWVGLFTAYLVALILLLTKSKELISAFQNSGIRPWVGIALVSAFPLLAVLFSTVPKFIEQRKIVRYSEITGLPKIGYFTLRPREDGESFERADNAHNATLRWIENTKESVLYLTGASGTGKSSLISAWVVPKLRDKKYAVIEVRGFEGDLVGRIREKLLQPKMIWDKSMSKSEELSLLLSRAMEHLGGRRFLIVVDQFEEFLILADRDKQIAFQNLLAEKAIRGLTFLLVFRPEYEGLIQEQRWPRLQLETNRKVISPFTESAAQEFMSRSGLTVNPQLLRSVLHEAAEIEQTVGLIRPVTINLCGLVLSRFSTGLAVRFRGGLLRGFLRETLLLPEVRDSAAKIIPQLISDSITKLPRTISQLTHFSGLPSSTVRACLRRLGESDRAIVRPLDHQQETWEISHDFLVPLLDSILARRTVSLWRVCRPWLPWVATGAIGIAAIGAPHLPRQDNLKTLVAQGWVVGDQNRYGDPDYEFGERTALHLSIVGSVPPESIPILNGMGIPLSLSAVGSEIGSDNYQVPFSIESLLPLKHLTALYLSDLKIADIEALKNLKDLTILSLDDRVTWAGSFPSLAVSHFPRLRVLRISRFGSDISQLADAINLELLQLRDSHVKNLSSLRNLRKLRYLELTGDTELSDLSPLHDLTNLESLNLYGDTKVSDLSPLRNLTSLTYIQLVGTSVNDHSSLIGLKNLKIDSR